MKSLPSTSASAQRLLSSAAFQRSGGFAGRRREKRQILQTLARADRAGVLLHGLDGAGKSSLSAEILRTLLKDRWLVASVHGEKSPDDVLAEVGRCYLAAFQQGGLSEADPRHLLAVYLGRPDIAWEDRFELLSRTLLEDQPLVLLLDDFDDNLGAGSLGPTLKSEDLAALLVRWVRNPGRSRLLVTSPLPFELPDRAHRRLETLHLGPLSFAETRKLFRRLPGLAALGRNDQHRAYTDAGGHPQTLEYLDVLLRGSASRFPDIAERMEFALEKKGIRQPEAWLRQAQGNLDQALAEAVTLAVEDVLLDLLLEKPEEVALARELLLGASVYRAPVDALALAWQVAEEVENPGDGPPLAVPEGFAEAVAALVSLGLLTPVAWSDTPEDARFAIPRRAAGAVLRRGPQDAVRQAHRRAARHSGWRADQCWHQNRQDAIVQLLEARHHHREAGDVDPAVEVTEWICSQLDTWGAWRREEQLCRETLGWLPERSGKAASFLHQLGIVAQKRGACDEALDWYQRSLRIKEELGDRMGMAISYHHLGMVAQDRGACDEALDWHQRSLRIKEELSDRAGMASSYHQLGKIAEDRGDSSEALGWYRKSLRIREDLGDRMGMAILYPRLGKLAEERGASAEALDWYEKSLPLLEELEDRTGMAGSYGQLGVLATEQGRPEDGLPPTLQSLESNLVLRSPNVQINLYWLRRQRELLGEERFGELLREQVGDEAAEAVLGMLAQMEAEERAAT